MIRHAHAVFHYIFIRHFDLWHWYGRQSLLYN